MPIVSITMIIELNKIYQEKGLPYKLHLSDACGKQSMWMEALNNDDVAQPPDELYRTAEEYFEKKHIRLEYSPDKHILWAAR